MGGIILDDDSRVERRRPTTAAPNYRPYVFSKMRLQVGRRAPSVLRVAIARMLPRCPYCVSRFKRNRRCVFWRSTIDTPARDPTLSRSLSLNYF